MSRVTRIEGRAMPVVGANIDTDRIIPARFLRTVSFDGLERHAFEDDRVDAARRGLTHPFDVPAYAGATILIVNANFGCGSSREHAPQALYRGGIRAIVGESFSEIFFGNSVMLGMPCVTVSSDEAARLQAVTEARPETRYRIDLDAMTLTSPDGAAPDMQIAMPSNAREALLSGAWDATSLLLDAYDEVERVASKLPYLSRF